MLLMAKKKRDSSKPEPKPYKSGGFQLYLGAELSKAFDDHLATLRPPPTKAGVVRMLIEDWLAQAGAWPPADQRPQVS